MGMGTDGEGEKQKTVLGSPSSVPHTTIKKGRTTKLPGQVHREVTSNRRHNENKVTRDFIILISIIAKYDSLAIIFFQFF